MKTSTKCLNARSYSHNIKVNSGGFGAVGLSILVYPRKFNYLGYCHQILQVTHAKRSKGSSPAI